MYKGIKKEERSKGYFLDAITAVKYPEESRYFKEGLSLLGVYLDSDYLLSSQVLADPYLSVNLKDEVGITLDIKLRPEDDENPLIGILRKVLDTTSSGIFQDFSERPEEDKKKQEELSKLTSLMMPKTIQKRPEDPIVTLFFGEDSVRLQRFKMLGENYYLFSLTDISTLSDGTYEHTLNIMFKDRDSSHETFFSGLVGSKLNINVTRRILESISQKNITGFFIGGATLNSEVSRMTTYALSSSELIYYNNEEDVERLQISTADTAITIDVEDINYTKVEVNSAGKYTLIFDLKWNSKLYLYLG